MVPAVAQHVTAATRSFGLPEEVAEDPAMHVRIRQEPGDITLAEQLDHLPSSNGVRRQPGSRTAAAHSSRLAEYAQQSTHRSVVQGQLRGDRRGGLSVEECGPRASNGSDKPYLRRGLECIEDSSPRTIESGRRIAMTLCPIAITAGCKKCPAFSFCPLKTVIGDQVQGRENRNVRKG